MYERIVVTSLFSKLETRVGVWYLLEFEIRELWLMIDTPWRCYRIMIMCGERNFSVGKDIEV